MAKKRAELSDLDKMLNEVRGAIARYGRLPEKEVYEALAEEAEGWRMRLEELNDEEP
jgi:hypothetical protein